MPYGSLNYSLLGAVGNVARTLSGTTTNASFSEGVHQAMLNVGVQFDAKFFFTKLEGSAAVVSAGNSTNVAPGAGLMIGFQW